MLTWSANCVITNSTGTGTFTMTYTKLYVTLSIQNNAKLLGQSKSGFKRIIHWNKYPSKKLGNQTQNQYLNYLIDASFQGVNKLFVLTLENGTGEIRHTLHYLSLWK